jgi:hypothetical protein
VVVKSEEKVEEKVERVGRVEEVGERHKCSL